MEGRVQGNSCLSCLYRFFNIFLIPVGLGVMVAGIYVSVNDSSFNWYNGSFIGLGLAAIVVAIIGHKSKFSLGAMTFYCICLLIISSAMIGFTIGIIAYSDFSNKLGQSSADAVRYSLLGACILMTCTFFLGVFYRNSLKLRAFEHDNDPKRKFINMPVVTPKTDKRREEMKAKYNL